MRNKENKRGEKIENNQFQKITIRLSEKNNEQTFFFGGFPELTAETIDGNITFGIKFSSLVFESNTFPSGRPLRIKRKNIWRKIGRVSFS